jgi:hypothetical protein
MKLFRSRDEPPPVITDTRSGAREKSPVDPRREARWRRTQQIVRQMYPQYRSVDDLELPSDPTGAE